MGDRPANHQMQLTSGGSLEVARTGRRFAPPFVRASFLSRRSQLIWVFYGRSQVAALRPRFQLPVILRVNGLRLPSEASIRAGTTPP